MDSLVKGLTKLVFEKAARLTAAYLEKFKAGRGEHPGEELEGLGEHILP